MWLLECVCCRSYSRCAPRREHHWSSAGPSRAGTGETTCFRTGVILPKDQVTWFKVNRLFLVSRWLRKSLEIVPKMYRGLHFNHRLSSDLVFLRRWTPWTSSSRWRRKLLRAPEVAGAPLVLSWTTPPVRAQTLHLRSARLFVYVHSLLESPFEFKCLPQLFARAWFHSTWWWYFFLQIWTPEVVINNAVWA